jgi:hypothetical protein
MIWALLAAFLMRRPAWMRALVFGTCLGLFVAAEVYPREPLRSTAVVLTVAVAVLTGGVFFHALRTGAGPSPGAGGAPTWVAIACPGAWLLVVGAAVRALVVEHGARVAVLAVVPIVLLAPPAVAGIRALLHRPSPAPAGSGAGVRGDSPAGRPG